MSKEKDMLEDKNEISEDIEIDKEGHELEENQDSEKDDTQEYLQKIDQLRKELDQAKKEQSDASDKMLRACAEMENIKRRSERDVTNAHKFALERFTKDLLPVLDSLEKACDISGDQVEVISMQEGIKMTLKMFLEVAEKYNLKQIDPIGKAFNPEEHEAIAMQPNPDMESNKVMAVFQKGYLLNGRVVRPARVVVTS